MKWAGRREYRPCCRVAVGTPPPHSSTPTVDFRPPARGDRSERGGGRGTYASPVGPLRPAYSFDAWFSAVMMVCSSLRSSYVLYTLVTLVA